MANTNAKIDEEKKWDDMFDDFKGLYDRLSDENKRIMLDYPALETEEDVLRCMGFMRFMLLFQVMKEGRA